MPTIDIAAAQAAGWSPEEIQQFAVQQGIALNPTGPRPGVDPRAIPLTRAPGSAEWNAKYGPLSDQNDLERVLAGTGQGMVNVGRQVGNMVGLVPDSSMTEAAKYDAPLLSDPSGRFGSAVGTTAALAPATMGAEYAAGLSPLTAALLRSRALTGAAEGSGQGAVLAGPGNRGSGAITGAITGAALPVGGSIAGKAIYGAKRTPEAQLLLDQGVSLTPGQMYPKGTANLIEQSLDKVPGVGPLVDMSRENAEQQFGRAVIQRGAAPGTTVTPSHNITDMYDQAAASWDPVYAQVHGYPIDTAGLDVALEQASRVPGLSPQRQGSINDWLQHRLGALGGMPQSEQIIGKNGLRSAIRAQQRNLLNTTDVDAPLMREAYEQAENAVNGTMIPQLPPQAAQILQDADRGYASLKLIGNAVNRSGDQLSGLTPAKLSIAIRQATDAGAYNRGAGGDLRDLARAGTSVFETTVPPTGVRTLGGLAAGALGYASPHVALPIMATAGGGAVLGAATPLGRRLAAGQTRPQTAAQSLISALQSNAPQISREVAAQTARAAINQDPRAQTAARGAMTLPLLMLPSAAGGR